MINFLKNWHRPTFGVMNGVKCTVKQQPVRHETPPDTTINESKVLKFSK